MAAILNFQIFRKIAKRKNAYISKTVLEQFRRNFWPTGYLHSSHANFQKNFVLLKMAAILNFRIFRKNCKTQKC